MNPPLIRTISHLYVALGSAICFALAGVAHAQLTWDVGATVDSIVTDGSGDWDASTSNWTDDGGATNTSFTTGDQVIFGGGTAGTAGTVTLTANIATQSSNASITVQDDYTFDLSGFTLSPGADNQSVFTILGGASVTIDDTAGTGSYVTGVTTQTFSHSITGSLTINAKVTDADGLGGANDGRMSVVGGGSLTLTNDANDFTGHFSKQNGGNLSFSSIADSGVASAAGAGDRVRIGFNARGVYTGSGDSTNRTFEFFGTSGGTLDNDGTGALIWTGAFENGTTGTAGAQTLNFGGSNTDDNDFQGILADHASNGNTLNITKNDGGKWIFSGDNTYTGTTTITSAGILQLGNGGTTGALLGTTGITNNSNLVINRSNAFTQATDLNGQAITGNGTLTQAGAGTTTLTEVNTYSGGTTVSAGTLALSGSGTLGGAAGDVTVSGGTLDLGALSRTRTGALTLTSGAISNGTLEKTGGTFDLQSGSVSAILAGTAGVAKSTSGTVTVTGANTYTGATTLMEGTLQADVADVASVSGALGNGGDITFGGGTLQYTANSAVTDYSGRIVNSTSAMIFDTNGEDVTMLNNFADSNTGGLIKEGTGTLTVQAARAGGTMNTAFAGDKVVNGGTLVFLNDDTFNLGHLNRGDFFINNGATLEIADDGTQRHIFQDTQFTFGITGGGTIDFADGALLQDRGGANTFTTNGGATNFIQSGNVSLQNSNRLVFNVADGTDTVDLQVSTSLLSGSIEKDGAGTLSLTSATNNLGSNSGVPNTITISEGTLQIGGGGRLQSGNYAGAIANNGTIEFATTANQTLSGIIDGSGNLIQSGSGTLTLSGVNTYTGTTTVSAGTLLVDGSTASGSAVSATGGTLGGTGTIGGASIVGSGASLTGATDGTIGTLSFSQDLTATGSTWLVDLAQDVNGSVDLIAVGGNLDITNATLTDQFTGSFMLGNTYTIATYTGSLTGTFSNWGAGVERTLGGGKYLIDYGTGSGSEITLTAVPEPAAFAPLLLLLLGGIVLYRRRSIGDLSQA